MDVSVTAIEDGNKEVEGIVLVNGWKEINQNLIKNKLVMVDDPDNIVFAKCKALGAAGFILKKDAKIQVLLIKIVVDDLIWNKLLGLNVRDEKIWVDEVNLKLVINK